MVDWFVFYCFSVLFGLLGFKESVDFSGEFSEALSIALFRCKIAELLAGWLFHCVRPRTYALVRFEVDLDRFLGLRGGATVLPL